LNIGVNGTMSTALWGQGFGVGLLPFIEQTALFNKWNSEIPTTSQSQGHPLWTLAEAEENQSVLSTVLPVFSCPSSPVTNEERIYTISIPANVLDPGLPPVDLSIREAAGDYGTPGGVRKAITASLNALGYHGDRGSIGRYDLWCSDFITVAAGVIPEPAGTRIADIEDGTANTVMLFERAGGPFAWRLRFLQSPADEAAALAASLYEPELPTSASSVAGYFNWGFTQWGDHWIKGCDYEGRDVWHASGDRGGPCGVNCSNREQRGSYAFHDGAHVCMGDGTVRLLSESINGGVFSAMMTLRGNENIGDF
jgi:hypothetical protein